MHVRFQVASLAMLVALCFLSPGESDLVTRSRIGSTPVRSLASRRGRPRKFNRPARAVTLTLPEDTIATLKLIDRDISRAVVRAVEPLANGQPRPPAELATFGDLAVIIVLPSRALRERTGADLVPLPDGRALVAFGDHLTASQFELKLRDALSDHALDQADRDTFESLVEILSGTRQRVGAGVHERSIMVLQA